MQVPTLTPVTVVPLIVQTPAVVLLYDTPRPEVAVALTFAVPPTIRLAGAAPKLMVWAVRLLSVTVLLALATSKLVLAATLKVSRHNPANFGVTVVPDTVHIVVSPEVVETTPSEFVDVVIVKFPAAIFADAGAEKFMVGVALVMVTVAVVGPAGLYVVVPA